jgi:hypothetical protein
MLLFKLPADKTLKFATLLTDSNLDIRKCLDLEYACLSR